MILRFRNGIPLGLFAEGAGSEGGGGGSLPASGAGAPAEGSAPPSAGAAGSEKPFADLLPEKYRADARFKDFKNIEGLADSFVHAQSMVGLDKNKLAVLPKDENDAEGYSKLYAALGRPEKADGYKLPARADGKDYSAEDKAFQAQMLPVLHEIGLTQAQISKLVPKWDGLMAQLGQANGTAATEAAAANESYIKGKWGAKFDENVELAAQALDHYAPEAAAELQKLYPDGVVKHAPKLMEAFAKLGAGLQEDGLLGKGGGGSGAMTPEAAKREIDAIDKDPAKIAILKNKDHKEYAELSAKRRQLYEYAYPEQNTQL